MPARAPAPRCCDADSERDGDHHRQRPPGDRLLRHARPAGARCPGDISVVGFNDMLFIDRLRPPLTSVRVPQREIGFAAADLLLGATRAMSLEAPQRDQARADAGRARARPRRRRDQPETAQASACFGDPPPSCVSGSARC